jgi:hypothetical protein
MKILKTLAATAVLGLALAPAAVAGTHHQDSGAHHGHAAHHSPHSATHPRATHHAGAHLGDPHHDGAGPHHHHSGVR